MGLFKRWTVNLVLILALLAYLPGLFLGIMDIDSAQYAVLSREMLTSGNFFQIELFGRDYLDQPPFLFWITSAFYWIFGIHEWSFRLGALLFSLVGVISTYKLGHLLYNKRIGVLAALMLMSSMAFIWMNHNIRTDTILTSAVVFSVWKLCSYLYYHRKSDLVWGFVGIAIAMMTKGVIGFLVPVFALGCYTVGRKRYRDLFRPEWLIGLALIGVLLLPMGWGLYEQFDAQPEKVLPFKGERGVQFMDSISGLKFFLWDQSFGGLSTVSLTADDLGRDYFIYTFLWSFFPWSLLAVWAMFWRLTGTVRDVIHREKKQEWLTLGGFLLPFITLSFSDYKLPHYIGALLPFAALFTSEFVLRIAFEKPKSWFRAAHAIQGINIAAAVVVVLMSVLVFFPETPWWWSAFLTVALAGILYLFLRGDVLEKLVVTTLVTALVMTIYLNGYFIPQLMKYQPSNTVARDLQDMGVHEGDFYVSNPPGLYSLAYYTGFNLQRLAPDDVVRYANTGVVYVYTRTGILHALDDAGRSYKVLKVYESYPVAKFRFEFLIPETRKEVLENAYLIALDPES